MRRIYSDWIAWSLLAAVIIVTGTEYYVQKTTGQSSAEHVYKIVVTASKPGS